MVDRPLSKLRNLGPACEADLHLVGIYSLEDIKRLGVEGTYVRLMEGRMQRGASRLQFNASYLYALYGALHDCDWRNVPSEKKLEFKQLAARLRKKYTRGK